jgi:hypothetical protein
VESGSYTASFRTPQQLLAAVVRALNELRGALASPDIVPAAQHRARELAAGDSRGYASGRSIRVAVAPVGAGVVLDAFALDDATITDRAIEAARRLRLISQTAGVQPELTSAGIVLTAQGSQHTDRTVVVFADDGAVAVEADASADGSMGFIAVATRRRRRWSGRPGSWQRPCGVSWRPVIGFVRSRRRSLCPRRATPCALARRPGRSSQANDRAAAPRRVEPALGRVRRGDHLVAATLVALFPCSRLRGATHSPCMTAIGGVGGQRVGSRDSTVRSAGRSSARPGSQVSCDGDRGSAVLSVP